MEEYGIRFKRKYRTDWIITPIKCHSYDDAKKIVMNMLKDDLYAKDYDYEYCITKNERQVGKTYCLVV